MHIKTVINKNGTVSRQISMESIKTENKQITGKIIHLNQDKGFGFISSEDIKFERIFFHWTSLVGNKYKFTELKSGMKIKAEAFEVKPNEDNTKQRGWRAIRIEIIS